MMYAMASGPRYGTIIRRARLRKRWTQERLAKAVSVSLRTVGDWENERSYPRNPVAVEDILGISLAGGPEPEPGDSGGGAPLSDAEREKLTEEYVRLGEEHARLALIFRI